MLVEFVAVHRKEIIREIRRCAKRRCSARSSANLPGTAARICTLFGLPVDSLYARRHGCPEQPILIRPALSAKHTNV